MRWIAVALLVAACSGSGSQVLSPDASASVPSPDGSASAPSPDASEPGSSPDAALTPPDASALDAAPTAAEPDATPAAPPDAGAAGDARGQAADAAAPDAAPPPILSISPAGHDFGALTRGSHSPPFTFTVENGGGAASAPLTVSVSDAVDFLVDGTCAGTALAAGASCTVVVTYAPPASSSVVEATAELLVGGELSARLEGSALSVAQLALSPAGADFGEVALSAKSPEASFTIHNDGESPSGPIALSLAGTDAASFALGASDCPRAGLAGKASCHAAVSFAPTALGARAASLRVAADPGGEVVQPVRGTGTATLTVARAGSGGGTVTTTQSTDISCGASCVASFAKSPIALAARADGASTFAGWAGGGCGGTGGCSVDLSRGPVTVTATFTALPSYPLDVTVTGGGAVTSSDAAISCPGTCAHTYHAVTEVTLHAVAGDGYYFEGWSGACAGTDDCALTMDGARSLTATFHHQPVTPLQAPSIVLGQSDVYSKTCNAGGISARSLCRPMSVASDGDHLWVSDAANARVLQFDLPLSGSPPAAALALGQASLDEVLFGEVSQSTLSWDEYGNVLFGLSVGGGRLWLADSWSARALRWDAIPTRNGAPASAVLGALDFDTVECGATGSQLCRPAGIWTDGKRVILADGANNRVMIWNDVTANGQAADVLLTGPVERPFWAVEAIHVDAAGRLYVSDRNDRILVWDRVPTSDAPPSFVIGQRNFADEGPNAGGVIGPRGLDGPVRGIVTWGDSLFVSDRFNHRVLVFSPIPTESFPAATAVLGLPELDTGPPYNPDDTFLEPLGLAVTADTLFVVDYNRVFGFTLVVP